jgi:hypothetical protein
MQKPYNDAEKIYSALFGKKIPDNIHRHFNNISKEIESNFPHDEVVKYYELVGKINDLEALEVAARHLRKIPVLTEKFKIMVYLGEAIPDNYHIFINESTARFRGYAEMIFSIMRTIIKMMKGLIIISAYRL